MSQLGCLKPSSSSSFTKNDLTPQASTTGFNNPPQEWMQAGVENPPPRFSQIVKKYADKYDLDWILILSVMKQESRFKPNAVSSSGAYGLMQIMPVTEIELAERLGVREARTPSNNIKAGIFHLKTLYRIFRAANHEDRVRLTLAAYNAGLGRVLDARTLVAYLGGDPNSWIAVRDALPLLSRRYYTLHKNVWGATKPNSGYFRNWKQTVRYVEKVMDHYDHYKLALR